MQYPPTLGDNSDANGGPPCRTADFRSGNHFMDEGRGSRWLAPAALFVFAVFGSTAHAFELMLAAFIGGLAFGGIWIRRRIDTYADPVALRHRPCRAVQSLGVRRGPCSVRSFTASCPGTSNRAVCSCNGYNCTRSTMNSSPPSSKRCRNLQRQRPIHRRASRRACGGAASGSPADRGNAGHCSTRRHSDTGRHHGASARQQALARTIALELGFRSIFHA